MESFQRARSLEITRLPLSLRVLWLRLRELVEVAGCAPTTKRHREVSIEGFLTLKKLSFEATLQG